MSKRVGGTLLVTVRMQLGLSSSKVVGVAPIALVDTSEWSQKYGIQLILVSVSSSVCTVPGAELGFLLEALDGLV